MAIYKVVCELFINSENATDASNEVFDVVNNAVNNYDGWMAGNVEKATIHEEDKE